MDDLQDLLYEKQQWEKELARLEALSEEETEQIQEVKERIGQITLAICELR